MIGQKLISNFYFIIDINVIIYSNYKFTYMTYLKKIYFIVVFVFYILDTDNITLAPDLKS